LFVVIIGLVCATGCYGIVYYQSLPYDLVLSHFKYDG